MDIINNGYRQYKKKAALNSEKYLANESDPQRPQLMVISCCDSRVIPNEIFSMGPGEIFSYRNIANIVPASNHPQSDSVASALEFGLLHLDIPHLIILGHTGCGGIKGATASSCDKDSALDNWLDIIRPAVCKNNSALTNTQNALNLSYMNLLSYPFIEQRLTNNLLTISRMIYQISDANLLYFNEKNKSYTLAV